MRIQMRNLLITFVFASGLAAQQNPGADVKFVADTVIVQAEGSYEADPDVATLTFDVSDQEKDFKQAYAKASQSMRNIVGVAEKNGLTKNDIQTGVLRMTPSYDYSDRKRKVRSYTVQGQIVLKVKDFSKVGSMVDDAIQDGIADFRSLSYSLIDEEAAKEKAVGQAMQRAVGRATTALEQSRQKLGPIRYVNLDVKHLVTTEQFHEYWSSQTVAIEKEGGGIFSHNKTAPPPPPPPPVQPEKISVAATVQCVFGIGQ